MLTANDLANRGTSVVAVSGTDPFVTGACWVVGAVCNGGSAVGTLSIFDATATSGTANIVIRALINDTKLLELARPIRFSTALHASIAGTGATAYLFYIAE